MRRFGAVAVSFESSQPYFDPVLRGSRASRFELYKRLTQLGVLRLMRDVRSRVGVFFVWKADRKEIRMIVDARDASARTKALLRTQS